METKVITNEVRFSFVNVFEPSAYESERPKYNLIIIIPKDDKANLNKIMAAIEAAKKKGETKYPGKFKADKARIPLQDGDEKRADDPAFKNAYYIRAKSENKPGIVDANCSEIINPAEVYSGCYGRVSINFFPYITGESGIGCGLCNVQKLRDGEPLSGIATAEVDFGDKAASEFDDLDYLN